jgi:CheY-like chemotaxis protein
MTERLKGKRILIVDDEPDVLEALGELLDMCEIDYVMMLQF